MTNALARSAETASTAVAAQAQAAVQARYVMAFNRPRNIDQVRLDLLKECKRPFFAEAARYNKPIGQGVTGPSIRFAEAAARCMGNILVETPTVYDDEQKRIVRVMATDLETNMTYQKDVTVTKTMERRSLPKGATPVRTRLNNRGETLYILEADDDAILNKENALVSKAMRTVLLRIIPGDLIDEAMWQVTQTLDDKTAKDPDRERRAMVDGFASVGVNPDNIVAYLGHELAMMTPKEIAELRGIFVAIRDGESSWSEVMANKEDRGVPSDGKTQTQKTAELLEKRKADQKAPEPPHDPKTGEVLEPAKTPPPPALANKTSRQGNAPIAENTKRGKFETDTETAEAEKRRLAAKSEMEREPGSDG